MPSVVIVVDMADVPLPVVIVKLPAGRSVALLAKVPDVHEAVAARSFTTTEWFPTVLPEAAEAETTFEFEELTVIAERGPVTLLRLWTSESRVEASVWI